MKKSIIFLAAIAAFFSCAKDNSVNNTTTEKTFSVTLTASAPTSEDAPSPASADTKTTLVDGNNKKFVHWSQGDAIRVLFFPKTTELNASFSGPSYKFESNVTAAASAVADFSCDSWSWGDKVKDEGFSKTLMDNGVAVYPSSAVATSSKPLNMSVNCNTEISFVLPLTQNAVENNIESGLNFSWAKVELSSFPNGDGKKTTPHLRFNNACAIIELTMPSTLDKKVTSISLVSNSGVSLTGKGSVRLTRYNNVVADPFGVDVTDGDGVTLLSDADGFKAGAKYYAVVWPGKHDSGLTIEFKAEDGSVATKTTPAVTLTASKVKPYTFNKGLVFEAPVMDYDYYYSDGTIGTDPKPSGKSVVGVVFYKGNPRGFDPSLPETCTHGLAISLVEKTGISWHSSNLSDDTYKNYGLNNTGNGLWGFTAKDLWQNSVGINLSIFSSLPHSTFGALPSLGEYVSSTGWYLPAGGEWDYIAKNLSDIDAKLEACGASKIHSTTSATSSTEGYLSPLASSKYNIYIVFVRPTNVLDWGSQSRSWATYYRVRPIFAF